MLAPRLLTISFFVVCAAACGDSATTPGADAPVAADGSAGPDHRVAADAGAQGDSAAADASTVPGFSSFAELYDKVFVKLGCANGYCHGSVIGKGGLSMLDADAAYADLVGVQSKSARCGGEMRVVAGKPDKSVLYTKVAKGVATCGNKMPPSGAPPLPDEVVDAIKSWIAAGAKR